MKSKYKVNSIFILFASLVFTSFAHAQNLSGVTFVCPFQSDNIQPGQKAIPLNMAEQKSVSDIQAYLDQYSESADHADEVDARAACLTLIADRMSSADVTSPNASQDQIDQDENSAPLASGYRDPAFQAHLDAETHFPQEKGNTIQLLDTGEKHWSELQAVIHNANRFLNLSYLQFDRDEVGYALTATLVAKRLQMVRYLTQANLADLKPYFDPTGLNLSDAGADEKIVARFLQIPGTATEITHHAQFEFHPANSTVKTGMNNLLTWYVQSRLKNSGATPEQIQAVLANSSQFSEKLSAFLADAVEIRVLLDFLNVESPVLHGDSPNELLGCLRQVGVQARFAPNLLFWISDHFKTTSSEHESIISGGNVIDKVMELQPSQISFRDTAYSLKGPAVSDVNQFFITRFYTKGTVSARLATEGKALYEYQPDPLHPVDPSTAQADARIISTVPFKSLETEHTFVSILHQVKNSFVIEMGFFSDPHIGKVLSDKADDLGLKDAKKQNGENVKHSTCDINILNRRPHIVVIVPRYGDQLFATISLKGIVPGMLRRGIDVCQWDGSLASELPENVAIGRGYLPRAMMHTKAWIADDQIAYLGSANLTHRSLWTDYELGMISTDPAFIQSLKTFTVLPDLASSVPALYHWYDRIINIASWFLNWGLWLD